MTIAAGSPILAADVKPNIITEIAQASGTNPTTYSLTTVANQQVIVIATGTIRFAGSGNQIVLLAYNGVTKDSMRVSPDGIGTSFTCMYTETPGAATHDITVGNGSGIEEMIIKLLVIKVGI